MIVNTVNVIEYICDDLRGVNAFSDDKEGNKEAEEIFKACVKENKANVNKANVTDEELELILEDGYFEQEQYKIFLIHSTN